VNWIRYPSSPYREPLGYSTRIHGYHYLGFGIESSLIPSLAITGYELLLGLWLSIRLDLCGGVHFL
jgi:hypothetical protein